MTIRSLVGASTGIDQSRFSILSANPGVLNGDFESIASVTLSNSGLPEFTNIPGTYQHLQLRCMMQLSGSATISGTYLRFNGDTGSNYAEHYLYGTGATAAAGGSASTTSAFAGYCSVGTDSIFGGLIIDILDYASTAKTKTVRIFGGADRNGSGRVAVSSFLWNSTSAITSLKAVNGGYDVSANSHWALYGIKAP